MKLPIKIPFAPMEALLVEEIPESKDWQYEPKWDGFRCLAFRDGRQVQLHTKLRRWRPDKAPAQCLMEQVKPAGKGALALLWGRRMIVATMNQALVNS
jgi:hypothetical protein